MVNVIVTRIRLSGYKRLQMLTNDYKRLKTAILNCASYDYGKFIFMRSYACLWTHAVFSTKKRDPLILPDHEIEIHQHLFQQLKKQSCIPIVVNGMRDHIHMLFAADYKKSVMEVMRDVKGETSFWVNKNRLMPHRLEWQDSFYVASVSEKDIPTATKYILNQKQHHQTKTLDDELNEMLSMFLIQYS